MSLDKRKTYCQFVQNLPKDDINRQYHDTQYGFKIDSDNELFGRLILEINQAGLSWTTILKKSHNIKAAFSNYNIVEIANYNDKNVKQLLSNKGIIRNKLKINAIIFNAKKIITLQSEYGSFNKWLIHHRSLSLEDWIKLFKTNFKFTGREITKEFLLSTGLIEGAHVDCCPIYKITHLKNNIEF